MLYEMNLKTYLKWVECFLNKLPLSIFIKKRKNEVFSIVFYDFSMLLSCLFSAISYSFSIHFLFIFLPFSSPFLTYFQRIYDKKTLCKTIFI